MPHPSGRWGPVSRPWNACSPCDIAPTETLGPIDQIDRSISPGSGFLHGGRQDGDIQHPAAVRKNAVAVCLRASVEDLDTLDLRSGIESADLAAFRVGVWIPLRREDHRKRG